MQFEVENEAITFVVILGWMIFKRHLLVGIKRRRNILLSHSSLLSL